MTIDPSVTPHTDPGKALHSDELMFTIIEATPHQFVVEVNGIHYQVGGLSLGHINYLHTAELAIGIIRQLAIDADLNSNAFNGEKAITFKATHIEAQNLTTNNTEFLNPLDEQKKEAFNQTFRNLQELSIRVSDLSQDFFELSPSDVNNPSLMEDEETESFFNPAFLEGSASRGFSSVSVPSLKTTRPITTKNPPFSLDSTGISSLYQSKVALRNNADFRSEIDEAGAGNVGYKIFQRTPSAKIGIMIAANSGLPGGKLGQRPDKVKEEDLNLNTQEESVWANAVLTSCSTNSKKQKQFHEQHIEGRWGMKNGGRVTDTATKQGIDFTSTEDPASYNSCYVVEKTQISAIEMRNKKKSLKKGSAYPATFVFADSVNANNTIGSAEGSMQRTLNKKAIEDYDFFKECIKMKLRSALDAMAKEGVTHPLVALLSCGVYAGKHQRNINRDFKDILQEVLEESVGPNREKRGQYFEDVILPKIS